MRTLIYLFLLVLPAFGYSQIEFKIERLGDDEHYLVSAIADRDLQGPENLISTAQVTLKFPSGDFQPTSIESLSGAAKWVLNGRCNSPAEEPGFDYIYFGLETMGTDAYEFKADQETPLFIFYNAGACIGEVALMKNEEDPFYGKNSLQVNVGNQMTVLGYGGDAYKGNSGNGKTTCSARASLDPGRDVIISPNPAQDFAVVHFSLDEAQTVEGLLRDAANKEIYRMQFAGVAGLNQVDLDLTGLPSATYLFELHIEGKSPRFARVVRHTK